MANEPDADTLEAFLKNLSSTAATDQNQAAAESAFRNLGRSLGFYLIGLLEAGLSVPIALNLTASMQALMLAHTRDRPEAP
jgi:hypothetical protein